MSAVPGLQVTEFVPVPLVPAIPGLEVIEWMPAAEAADAANEAANSAAPALRILEHGWRGGGRGSQRMRAAYWNDWQADEGAAMDAPTLWHPAGATRGTVYMGGTDHAYVVRSGHAYGCDPQPAVQIVFPTVRGQRYHCRLERGRLVEVRAQRAGARRLRVRNALWFEIESAAWTAAA